MYSDREASIAGPDRDYGGIYIMKRKEDYTYIKGCLFCL